MSRPTPAQLGAVIRETRESRDVTIEALAEAAGLHWTSVSMIERGNGNPSWTTLTALSEALGVPVSQIALMAEDAAEGETPSA